MVFLPQVVRFTNCQIRSVVCLKNGNHSFLNLVRPVSLKPQAARQKPSKEHDEKNMAMGRPMSPHLTIYAPQLTSMLSIVHRMTGGVLAGYAILFGLGIIILPHDYAYYINSLARAPSLFIYTLKLMLSFPLCYHYFNGIRHLTWDIGKCLAIKEVYTTGYIVVGASAATTFFLVFIK